VLELSLFVAFDGFCQDQSACAPPDMVDALTLLNVVKFDDWLAIKFTQEKYSIYFCKAKKKA
jgi:hypothetical protein